MGGSHHCYARPMNRQSAGYCQLPMNLIRVAAGAGELPDLTPHKWFIGTSPTGPLARA